jgi:hypothetical protein
MKAHQLVVPKEKILQIQGHQLGPTEGKQQPDLA